MIKKISVCLYIHSAYLSPYFYEEKKQTISFTSEDCDVQASALAV